jgi:hypothetical protein
MVTSTSLRPGAEWYPAAVSTKDSYRRIMRRTKPHSLGANDRLSTSTIAHSTKGSLQNELNWLVMLTTEIVGNIVITSWPDGQ